MSVRGDFAKLARIRDRIRKAPGIAPEIAKRAAASRTNFVAEGGAVRITVNGEGGKPRKRRRPFWGHGYKLNLGFMPPQWMRAIKVAADAAFAAISGGR